MSDAQKYLKDKTIKWYRCKVDPAVMKELDSVMNPVISGSNQKRRGIWGQTILLSKARSGIWGLRWDRFKEMFTEACRSVLPIPETISAKITHAIQLLPQAIKVP